jgi:hypothetical protein
MHRIPVMLVLSVCTLLLLPAAEAQVSDACAKLSDLRIPGADLQITSTKSLSPAPMPKSPMGSSYQGTVPAHCRVDGVLESRNGVNKTPYGIGFALALPSDWNGRFLFQGGGGLNGAVQMPLGGQVSGDAPALAKGFAIVSTDSGHKGSGFDAKFFEDQEAALNFLYLAVGKVTVVAKQMVASYYGRPIEHSYFVGCSTGGREAMIVSQRYPRYFDGVVSGAPAMRTGFSNLGMRWVSVALSQAAADDKTKKPGSSLSDSEKKLIVRSALQACDGKDGLEDGMISNPTGCGFDPATLTCTEAKNDQCLTAKQVNAVKKAMSGAKTAGGRQVYAPYLYDTGIAASGQGIPGLLNGAASPAGSPTPPSEQDVEAEALIAATEPSVVGDTKMWTNLSTFSGNGGKLIFYHGVSDPWFSALDTVDYYQSLAPSNGGAEHVSNWSRLFLVPGMGHCGGGEAALDRFDMLTAITDWVEKGNAPNAILATGNAFPGRSRPLCPYPKHAHYKGSGNPDDAANFECR